MAYIKTDWKDRLVERPRTFTMQQNVDGSVTLNASEGEILEAGTPVNALNMNKIEDGIEEVASSMADLTYQELSSYASNIDDNGLYKTVTWKRKDNTTYAVSSLIGTAPYTQVKIDYYNDLGTTIIKSITWGLTYDDNEFIYNKVVV